MLGHKTTHSNVHYSVIAKLILVQQFEVKVVGELLRSFGRNNLSRLCIATHNSKLMSRVRIRNPQTLNYIVAIGIS